LYGAHPRTGSGIVLVDPPFKALAARTELIDSAAWPRDVCPALRRSPGRSSCLDRARLRGCFSPAGRRPPSQAGPCHHHAPADRRVDKTSGCKRTRRLRCPRRPARTSSPEGPTNSFIAATDQDHCSKAAIEENQDQTQTPPP
jgi:hypothetical protein